MAACFSFLSVPLSATFVSPLLKAGEEGHAGILASQAPTANAGADQSVSVDTTVNFDGTLSTDLSGTANYTWTFVYRGHQTNMYGARPSFFFDSTGTYTITLNVTDSTSHLSGTDQVVVRVSQKEAGTESLVYSGGIAALIAALLLALFVGMRKRRGDWVDDGPEEEEFEDTVEEILPRPSKK